MLDDTKLLVIGDSHASFWNGTSDSNGYDTLPGVRVHSICGALAWNLIEDVSTTNSRALALGTIYSALAEGFTGWILFAFGSIDCECYVLKNTPILGFERAVRAVVDRYVTFLLEVQTLHPKVAVWTPYGARKSRPTDVVVGSEIERNLVILVFGAMLREQLAAAGIPVISFTEVTILESGRTNGALFWDNGHLSQALMPHALAEINATLGLDLTKHSTAVQLVETKLTDFDTIDEIEKGGNTWLRFVIAEGAQFITEIGIFKFRYSSAVGIIVATSLDTQQYIGSEYACLGPVADVKEREYLPVGRPARTLLIRATSRRLDASEIDIYARSTIVYGTGEYSKLSLLALRDAIVPPHTTAPRPIAADALAMPASAPPLHNLARATLRPAIAIDAMPANVITG